MSQVELFAVAGRPILHSLSPVIFGAAFRSTGRHAIYSRLAVDTAEECLRLARELGLRGMNVTSPLKEEILPLLDSLDPAAQAIGAVNCVVARGGKLVGHNTDPAGVRAMLDAAGIRPAGAKAALLGAGGAARAAVYALVEGGAADVLIVNRSADRGRRTAADFGARFAPWEDADRAVADADLVFSCLPTTVAPLDPAWLREGQVVLDANYKSPRLSEVARQAGCRYAGGRDWLLGQALEAYRVFLREEPPAAAMAEALAATAIPGSPDRIALSGMMGTGKTATAEWLAKELALDWLDTDRLVERSADCTISELFARQGEAAFRNLESEMVDQAVSGPPAVIALGGGALISSANRARVAAEAAVVWLWADVDTCFHRARGETRPLLAVADPRARLRFLLAQRLDSYSGTADLIVDTVSRSPHEVACKILEEIVHTWPR